MSGYQINMEKLHQIMQNIRTIKYEDVKVGDVFQINQFGPNLKMVCSAATSEYGLQFIYNDGGVSEMDKDTFEKAKLFGQLKLISRNKRVIVSVEN